MEQSLAGWYTVEMIDGERVSRWIVDTDDRTEDARCSFCNAPLASDGDCDACQAEYERTGRIG